MDRPQWLAPQRPINEICRRQSRDVDTAVRRIRHGLSNARFDAIDLHLYDDPQNWGVYIEAFRQIIGDDVEVIVSEFGGPHPSIKEMRVEEQAKLLVESIVALAEQGIRSAYFFKLVEGPKYPHPISGLMKAERAGALPNVKAPMFEAVAAYNRMTSEARQKPPTKPIEQP